MVEHSRAQAVPYIHLPAMGLKGSISLETPAAADVLSSYMWNHV